MWQEIKKIIHEHQRFVLTTHVNPDGDGIGAACALAELLFGFLNYRDLFEVYDPTKSYDDIEVMIILDAHTKDRVGHLQDLFRNPHLIVGCIDHHIPCVNSISTNTVIDSDACSVGAMIYSLFLDSGFEINLFAATGIYTSVVCDTGRFSYSSTSRNAHAIADACIRSGVDPDEMHYKLFQHVPLAQIKLFAAALQKMEIHLDNKVIVQQLHCEDCNLEYIDLEYMHEFNKLIDEVECVVLLHELENNLVRVSLRSKSSLDVAQLVKELGGGGHTKAAGATLKGSLESVKSQILSLLKIYLAQAQLSQVI
jgi:phosphoesterase RecJ-like protein